MHPSAHVAQCRSKSPFIIFLLRVSLLHIFGSSLEFSLGCAISQINAFIRDSLDGFTLATITPIYLLLGGWLPSLFAVRFGVIEITLSM